MAAPPSPSRPRHAHGRRAPHGRRPRPLAPLLRRARSASSWSAARAGKASLGAGRDRAARARRGAGRPPGRASHGPVPLRAARAGASDLARWLAHAARERVPLVGMSDHFVSEAIYLTDPDGHGIEIYHDRPREVWEGQVGARMTTEPLDVARLLGELDDPATAPFDGLPAGTDMGHVHLQVADVARLDRLLPGRPRLRRSWRSCSGSAAFLARRRLPPPRRRERLAQPRRPAGSSGNGQRSATRPSSFPTPASATGSPRGSRRRSRSRKPSEDGVLVRDPSGIDLLLARLLPRGADSCSWRSRDLGIAVAARARRPSTARGRRARPSVARSTSDTAPAEGLGSRDAVASTEATRRARDATRQALAALMRDADDPSKGLEEIAVAAYSDPTGRLLGDCHGLMHTVGREYAAEHERHAGQPDDLPAADERARLLRRVSPTASSPPSRPRSTSADPASSAAVCDEALTPLPALQLRPRVRPRLHAARPRGPERGAEALLRARRRTRPTARRAPSTTTGSRSPAPTTRERPETVVEDPRELCGAQPDEFVRPCWYRAFIENRPEEPIESGADILALCEGLDGLQRQACITAALGRRAARPERCSSPSAPSSTGRRPRAASAGRRCRT